ncbi:MAG: hypothetical protein KJ064_01030 [Anaerolineae bacterium]|nr:hypothetical protein [Anaerolineae bacterium]
MKVYRYLLVVGLLLLTASLALWVGAQEPPSDDPLGEPPTFLAGFYEAWVNSPHADVEAEAFVHWDAEGEVPESCATCHTTPGYQDFLGADGSEAGTVDAPAPIGTVINCDACHNQVASSLTAVSFPSGVEITDLGESARCMVCHQGRASANSVNAKLEELGLTEEPNTISAELGFINIHYYAAAASLYGYDVHGGYEFDGLGYQKKFRHVEGIDSCTDCHSPHTLEVRVNSCATCHEGVESVEDVLNIRMAGSMVDYDGDGDVEEGIAGEISTLQETLYATIQAYASEVSGTPIVYDEHTHPYFFADPNANGVVDEGEAIRDNAYTAFTPLLLKAAYNYQVSKKDPGGYVHNAKYHIELLYDSITVLNEQLSQMADTSAMQRDDAGHFNSTGEPFRHWDADGEVPGSCAKCHTAEGLPTYLHNNANIAVEPSDSLACSTCHNSIPEFTVYEVEEVTFPSGARLSFRSGKENNLCLNCHQGRESTTSVNRVINAAGVGDDEVTDKLTFRNVHYFAAGATLFGGDAQGGYQYEGKEYVGQFEHESPINSCTDCHDQHALTLQVSRCTECHEDVSTVEDVQLIRAEADGVDAVDYDGDGDTDEPVADEIATLRDALLPLIQAYATETTGAGIVYESHSHPYWFIDTNANGVADPEEVNGDNRFVAWTPNLLRAAYNYQYVQKDPGAFAHNADYILQLLYDSLESIGGPDAVASFNRPPLRED